MGKLILLFKDRAETFEVENIEQANKQADYWVCRRLDKCGEECESAYYSESPIDVSQFITGHLDQQYKYERELQEIKEKKEYERLKNKYERAKE